MKLPLAYALKVFALFVAVTLGIGAAATLYHGHYDWIGAAATCLASYFLFLVAFEKGAEYGRGK